VLAVAYETLDGLDRAYLSHTCYGMGHRMVMGE